MPDHYGNSLYVWDWGAKKTTQEIVLGPDGLIPLEVRFLHDPAAPHGFVGAALSSNNIHFTRVEAPAEGSTGPGTWDATTVFKQPWLDVEGWM